MLSRRSTSAILSLAFILSFPLPGRAQTSERGGFTVLVDAGVGVQQDSGIEESAVGLAGLNFGVGGFLNENLAVLFRLSGTNVSYDTIFGDIDQVSGVAGPALQYWVSDRVNVEGGVGVGFWTIEDSNDNGLGLILGTGITLLNRGKHNVQFGIQYAPAFTDPGTVHNFGFTVGYQFL